MKISMNPDDQMLTDEAPIGTAMANSVESDLRCTSMICFDNMTLMLHNLTLTSQKPCQHNNKCDCSKTNRLNKLYVFVFFSIKYGYILLKNHKLYLFCQVIKIIYFNIGIKHVFLFINICWTPRAVLKHEPKRQGF